MFPRVSQRLGCCLPARLGPERGRQRLTKSGLGVAYEEAERLDVGLTAHELIDHLPNQSEKVRFVRQHCTNTARSWTALAAAGESMPRACRHEQRLVAW